MLSSRLFAGTSLLSLALPGNRINGRLPYRPPGLPPPSLYLLDLSNNALTGPLPDTWSSWQSLRYLYLSGNNFSSPSLPVSWGEPGGLPALALADLSGNPGLHAVPPPRSWMRRFCSQEGAFVCLQRGVIAGAAGPGGVGGACGYYIYGSSDRHQDSKNACDHGLSTPLVLWAAFLVTLLLLWLARWRQMRLLAAAAAPPVQRPSRTRNGPVRIVRLVPATGFTDASPIHAMESHAYGGALLPCALTMGTPPPPPPPPRAPLVVDDGRVDWRLLATLANMVASVRLLLLWGLAGGLQSWPSMCLLGLLIAPHAALAFVVHFRLLAAACLPPAIASTGPPLQPQDHVPGASQLIAFYSYLAGAPAWVAYPTLLLVLPLAVALLTVLCPCSLPLYLLGAVSAKRMASYLRLLQACTAVMQAPACAILLTVFWGLGNGPEGRWYLDASLFYLPLLCCMADMLCALDAFLSRSIQLSEHR